MKAKSYILTVIFIILFFGFLFILPTTPQQARAATEWYVAPGGNDSNDCLSPGTACATITAALDKAASGDSVILMPGTYSEASGEVFPINMKPGIHLLGSGRETTAISGPIDYIIFTLDGYDYYSDTSIQNMTIQDSALGIQMTTSGVHTISPVISGLSIQSNTMGISFLTNTQNGDGGTIAPVISDTLIISNTTDGIFIEATALSTDSIVMPTFQNCTIDSNGYYGIAIYAYAENNHTAIAAPHIIHSQVLNSGITGMYILTYGTGLANPSVDRSWIKNNAKYGIESDRNLNSDFNITISNTVVAMNQSGGIYILDQSPEKGGSFNIVNSNIQDNQYYGIKWEASYSNNINPSIVNSILWNPSADDLYSSGDTWTVDEVAYSDIANGDFKGQNGNFSADPLFWDEYHLDSCSPAIDAGTDSEMPPVDIDGDPRPMGLAPDVGVDEQGAPCLLSADKQVSETVAHLGDTLVYTITLTPTDVITPFQMVLTDTIPQPLALEQDSLWASQGQISFAGDLVSWQGVISPTIPVRLGYKANPIAVNTTAENYALINAYENGLYRTPTVTTAVTYEFQYLSFVAKSPPPKGIYGKVTDDGKPAYGVLLYLRFFDGSSWSTKATLYTDGNGAYSFLNVPGLNPGQYYYVRYQNEPGMWNNHLWTWHTQSIGSYQAGSDYLIGDFDIRDISLLLPFPDTTINLPYPFQWTIRPNSPTDSYEFNLYDSNDGDPYFYTNQLGYVNSYTLTNRPPGFNPSTLYVWEIWAYSPDGGFGISFETRLVYFANKTLQIEPDEQPPMMRQMPDLENRISPQLP